MKNARVHPEIISNPDETPLSTDRKSFPGQTGSTSKNTLASHARRHSKNEGTSSKGGNGRTTRDTKKNVHLARDISDFAPKAAQAWLPNELPPIGDLDTDIGDTRDRHNGNPQDMYDRMKKKKKIKEHLAKDRNLTRQDSDTSPGSHSSDERFDMKEKAQPGEERYGTQLQRELKSFIEHTEHTTQNMVSPPEKTRGRNKADTSLGNNGGRKSEPVKKRDIGKTINQAEESSSFESEGAKLHGEHNRPSEQTESTTQNTVQCQTHNSDLKKRNKTGPRCCPCRLPKIESVYKVVKLFVYIILFACVLGSLLVSKATLLLITANMRPGIKFSCSGQTPPNCVLHSHQSRTSVERARCITNNGNSTVIPICDSLTVRWIWAGFLVICTPHVLTVLANLSKMLGWVCKLCLEDEDGAKEGDNGDKKSEDRTKIGSENDNGFCHLVDKEGEDRTKIGSENDNGFCHLVMTLISEVLHAIGVSLLVFRVLPGVSSVLGAVIGLGASTIPALGDCMTCKGDKKWQKLKLALGVLCVITQLSALVLWPVLIGIRRERFFRGDSTGYEGPYDFQLVFLIPISLLLISCRYWDNYLPCEVRNTKSTLTSFVAGIVKIATTFFTVIFLRINTDGGVQGLFNIDSTTCNGTLSISQIPGMKLDWVWIWLICTGSGMLAYLASLSAARAHIQLFSYSLPVLMSSPLLVMSLILACQAWNGDHCALMEAGLPGYIWFHCFPKGGTTSVLIHEQIVWIAIFWWFSQIWTTAHVWFPEEERLATSEKLFVLPMWDAVVLEQDLLHNRRRNKTEKSERQENAEYGSTADSPRDTPARTTREKKTPVVYLCATMWHESEQEMKNLLDSFVKLDEAKTGNEIYELAEVQIYFDDAFERDQKDDKSTPRPDQVNKHVRRLFKVIEDIEGVKASEPCSTLYGGRRVWELKRGTKLVAHLKDKLLIKIKKRRSQVMYMNYIMRYREVENSKERDVYVLALDGDVDFEPSSVELLVDMMEKEKDLGAVCGRIKPVGSGVTYWYQVFEYAIGHWLQKATEHVFGCVLCSPGCFSMFRGSALVKGNRSVLDIYSTLPTEPEHHLQYDLGEDRWLCTLLIKHGYRVDYCAAADARTFVPESLGDFFRQRRRWSPSTMVNIKDLLWDWKTTYIRNAHVSLFYLAYQGFLFIMSMFGPGTIFLMISGALHAAFSSQGLSIVTAILLNALPVFTFTLACFKGSSSLQLTLARILTIAYALLQFVVLIGIVTQLVREGLCSPISFFFFFVAGTFVLAACLHPQEFGCIFTGFIYFLLIPSMYLFLVLFAMINMHDLSWGTREKERGQKTNDHIFAKIMRAISRNRSAADKYIMTNMSTQTSDSDFGNSREVPRDNGVDSSPEVQGEQAFFQNLISDTGVLKIETPSQKEAELNKRNTEEGLKSLRNKVSLYFLLSNTALVLIIFTIQLQNRNTGLSIPWPCNGKTLLLEPVGILFLFSYCLIMAVQIIGMLFHCFQTFLHINAFTKLGLKGFLSTGRRNPPSVKH